ncbi:hypothetical protein POVCU2_0043690 [Plasmodium ovale curtisi]|uniref:Uncharacterized protein n=1 Tax=Plasmodium ovale curtisi TaxID=864141 RepID=A0A1A8W8X8_PLAOA|nr:hypothetical protein POVCU2_0043690 [Plasmodium ovale curtisi]SBS97716.1 hypothetical protein POVCU1_040350 [Plasmodium ovale curtisi]
MQFQKMLSQKHLATGKFDMEEVTRCILNYLPSSLTCTNAYSKLVDILLKHKDELGEMVKNSYATILEDSH